MAPNILPFYSERYLSSLCARFKLELVRHSVRWNPTQHQPNYDWVFNSEVSPLLMHEFWYFYIVVGIISRNLLKCGQDAKAVGIEGWTKKGKRMVSTPIWRVSFVWVHGFVCMYIQSGIGSHTPKVVLFKKLLRNAEFISSSNYRRVRLKSVDKSVMRCKKLLSLLCIALQPGLLVAFRILMFFATETLFATRLYIIFPRFPTLQS